MIVMY